MMMLVYFGELKQVIKISSDLMTPPIYHGGHYLRQYISLVAAEKQKWHIKGMPH